MKAFLLAAGEGTRLRPYTDQIPKCLVPIHGKPLLKIWLDLLAAHRVKEVLINTHHHADQVDRFVKGIQNDLPLSIITSYEKKLLGSGGTIMHNRWFVDGCNDFIIAYADNLTCLNLGSMMRAHDHYRRNGAVLTMGLFYTTAPQACGIAVLDPEKKITSFIEKPETPASNLANAGIYIATKDIFDYKPLKTAGRHGNLVDMGYHILPAMIGKMFGYIIREYLRDIGTIQSYYRALKEWPDVNG